MAGASWSFQRVSGTDYSVRVRLATPDTVDKLCGSVGVKTQGVYSCRFGQTLMINLRRWLHGAPNFPVSMTSYRNNVINHEMGHFLGFDHMHCPAAGQPAPIMMQQTINIEGCLPNEFPFAADGTFIMGAGPRPDRPRWIWLGGLVSLIVLPVPRVECETWFDSLVGVPFRRSMGGSGICDV